MTTMWEVRAVDGKLAELQAWVLEHADQHAQIYRSEDRLVVIDPSGQAGVQLAGLPDGLAARPAHAWDFEVVRNV